MSFAGAVVLRPEPGAAATAARLAAAGVAVRRCPLFATAPVAWTADPDGHDALFLTSANAVRLAGPGLSALADLPVLAVGEATAAAARRSGLRVALTGIAGAAELLAAARARGFAKPLHLAGRDRIASGLAAVTVYRSDPAPVAADDVRGWVGHVALLHSARAARRFAALVDMHGVDRARVGIAALGQSSADAAGPGWAALAVADRPGDALLVARAAALIDPAAPWSDKRLR